MGQPVEVNALILLAELTLRSFGQIAQFILFHLIVDCNIPTVHGVFGWEIPEYERRTLDMVKSVLKYGAFFWLVRHLRASYNALLAEEALVQIQYDEFGCTAVAREHLAKVDSKRVFLQFPLACLFLRCMNTIFLSVFNLTEIAYIVQHFTSTMGSYFVSASLIAVLQAALALSILDYELFKSIVKKQPVKFESLLELVRANYDLQSDDEALKFIEDQMVNNGEEKQLQDCEKRVDEMEDQDVLDHAQHGYCRHVCAKMSLEEHLVKKVYSTAGYVGLLRRTLELGTTLDDETFDRIEQKLDVLKKDSEQAREIMELVRKGEWEFVAPPPPPPAAEDPSDAHEASMPSVLEDEAATSATVESTESSSSSDDDMAVLHES